MVNNSRVPVYYKRSYYIDEQLEHEPSVEVPIGDGTASIYGTTVDAYRVRL